MGPADWPAIETEISRIIAENDASFSASAVAHVRDFLEFARGRCPVPEVASGYWCKSIRFCWNAASFEIEVFEDRLELYRFHDQRTEIRHYAHVAGSLFQRSLLSSFLHYRQVERVINSV
jgi:hypothetical protein